MLSASPSIISAKPCRSRYSRCSAADLTSGEVVTITDRGRPVAQLTPIPRSHLDALRTAGHTRTAKHSLADVPAPEPGPALSAELAKMREAERY